MGYQAGHPGGDQLSADTSDPIQPPTVTPPYQLLHVQILHFLWRLSGAACRGGAGKWEVIIPFQSVDLA